MMMAKLSLAPVISLIFLAFPLSAAAQDFSIGQHEFMNSCAHCHGASGKGEGIIAGYLTESVPDLTTLQKENEGVFPFARLYQVIDGTDSADVHGTREMPVWGDRYMRTQPGDAVPPVGEYGTRRDQEIFARGRILALIEYISTLQEQ
jgi:mono/diheme cytochrome c family protein